MSNDLQFWLATMIAVVVAVSAAVLQVALATGWTYSLGAQLVLYIVAGIMCVLVLRFLANLVIGNSNIRPVTRRVTLVLVAIIVFGACAGTFWTISYGPVPSAQASSSSSPATVANQLARAEWALDGESCERDGIRFAIEGEQLVAYPRGALAIRFEINQARGQRLTTSRSNSLVIFEVRVDGFTYFEGGQARWYRRCG